MPENEQNFAKNYGRNAIILTVILSLVFGSISGGAVSFLILRSKPGAAGNPVARVWQNLTQKSAPNPEPNLETETIDVVKNTQPSVVSIVISKKVADIYNNSAPDFNQMFNFGWPFEFNIPQPTQPILPKNQGNQLQEIGSGSGFIVSADGLILTNKHVVDDSTATYTVVTNDGQKHDATILGTDPINDLAVVKIDAKNLKPLVLGDSDKIQIGQTVIAIGNALGEFQNTVTRGVVSGINRTVQAGGNGLSETLANAIQTDAAINPGNSGGPLLNTSGEVIGINTAISQQGQLVGFAIPINEAKQVLDSIKKYGKIVRPWLGLRYVILNKEIAAANNLKYDYGALVISGQNPSEIAVVPGSPADKAGIVENDIILEIDGTKIDENHPLTNLLANHVPGDTVTMKIFHKDGEKTIKVKLDQRPEGK